MAIGQVSFEQSASGKSYISLAILFHGQGDFMHPKFINNESSFTSQKILRL